MSKFCGGYYAYRILQFAFIVVPIIAGLDKFFYFLTNWSQYISPFAMKMLGQHSRGFMIAVGVIEIIAGLGVIFKPRIFAYVVFLWLLVIIFNLLMAGRFFDIVLRDFGLALAALALGNLSCDYCHPKKAG